MGRSEEKLMILDIYYRNSTHLARLFFLVSIKKNERKKERKKNINNKKHNELKILKI